MSEIGLVFDSSSFDAFNRALEKFKSIGSEVDKVLERMAKSIEKIDDKKIIGVTKSIEKFSIMANKISVSNGLGKVATSLEMLDNIVNKISFDRLIDSLKTISTILTNTTFLTARAPFLRFLNNLYDTMTKFEKLNVSSLDASANNIKNFLEVFAGQSSLRNITTTVDEARKAGFSIKGFFTDIRSAFSTSSLNPLKKSGEDAFNIVKGFVDRNTGLFGALSKFNFSNVTKVETLIKAISRIVEQIRVLSKLEVDTARLRASFDAIRELTTVFAGKTGFEQLRDTFSNLSGFFTTGSDGFSGLSKIANEFKTNGFSFGGILKSIGSVFSSSIVSGVGGISDIFGANGIIDQFSKFSGKETQGFRVFANSMRDIILALNTLTSIDLDVTDVVKLRAFFEKFAILKDAISQIVTLFSGGTVIDKFANIFSAYQAKDYTGMARGVGNLFGGGGLIQQIGKFSDIDLNKVTGFLKSIGGILRALGQFNTAQLDNSAINNITDALEKIVRVFSGTGGFLGFFKKGILSDISKFSTQSIEKMGKFFTSVSNMIRAIKISNNSFFDVDVISNVGNALLESADIYVKAAKKLEKINLNVFKTFAESIATIVKTQIKPDIVAGFKGIDTDIGDYGEKSAEKFITEMKDEFQIASPSKSMEQIAEDVVDGFLKGLSGFAKGVSSTVKSVLSVLSNGLLGGFKGILKLLGKDTSNLGEAALLASIDGIGTGLVAAIDFTRAANEIRKRVMDFVKETSFVFRLAGRIIGRVAVEAFNILYEIVTFRPLLKAIAIGFGTLTGVITAGFASISTAFSVGSILFGKLTFSLSKTIIGKFLEGFFGEIHKYIIRKFGVDLPTAISNVFQLITETISNKVINMVNVIKSFPTSAFRGIINVVKNFADGLRNAFITIDKTLSSIPIIRNIYGTLRETILFVSKVLIFALEDLFKKVKGIVTGILGFFPALGKAIGGIVNIVGKLWEAIGKLPKVISIPIKIVLVGAGVIATLTALWAGVVAGFNAAIASIFLPGISGLAIFVATRFINIFELILLVNLYRVLKPIILGIVDFAKRAFETIAPYVKAALDKLAPIFKSTLKFFEGVFKGLGTFITNAAKYTYEQTYKFFQNLGTAIKNTFISAFDTVKRIITNIGSFVANQFSRMKDFGKGLFDGAITGARNFISAFNPINILAGLERIGQAVFYIRQLIDSAVMAMRNFYNATIGVSVSFESAFTGVIKTLEAPADIIAQGQDAVDEFFAGIREGINEMATSPESLLSGLDNAFVTLSKIAENAGAMGIASDQVLEFTEVVGQLTLATDLTADSASQLISIFSTVTGTQNFQELGGTIVALGNATAATESQIAEIAQRIVGVGNVAGFTQPEILGWSAAIRSLGIEAELGGTAFNTLVTEITKAVSAGGDRMEEFANLAGLTGEQFTQLWNTDVSTALHNVVVGLNELDNASRVALLETLELDGARMSQFISLIASNTEELDRILGVANDSFVSFGDSIEDYNALQEETARRSATTESNINRLKNVLQGLGDVIGQFALPAYNQLLTTLSFGFSRFGDILVNNRLQIQETVDAVTNSIGSLFSAFGSLISSVLKFLSIFTGGQNPVMFFFEGLSNIIRSVSEDIVSFSNMISGIATRISGISDVFLREMRIGNAVDAITNQFRTVDFSVETVRERAITAGKDILGGIQDGVTQAFSEIRGDLLSRFVDKIITIDDIRSAASRLSGSTSYLLKNMLSPAAIRNTMNETLSEFGSFTDSISQQMFGSMGLVSTGGSNNFFNSMREFTEIVNTNADAINGNYVSAFSNVNSEIERFNDSMTVSEVTVEETTDYLIQQGDTLSEIASQYGTTVDELVRLNNIEDPNLIFAGDTLLIPTGVITTYEQVAENTTIISENIRNIRDGFDSLVDIEDIEGFRTSALAILSSFENIARNARVIGRLLMNLNPQNARQYGQIIGNSLRAIATNMGSIFSNILGIGSSLKSGNGIKELRQEFFGVLEGIFNLEEGELEEIISPFIDNIFSTIASLMTGGFGVGFGFNLISILGEVLRQDLFGIDTFLDQNSIGKAFTDAFVELADVIDASWRSVLDLIMGNITFEELTSNLSVQLEEFRTKFLDLFEAILTSIVGEDVAHLGRVIADFFIEVIQTGFALLTGQGTEEQLAELQSTSTELATSLGNAFVSLMQSAVETIPQLMSNGGEFLSSLGDAAGAIINGLAEEFNKLSTPQKILLALAISAVLSSAILLMSVAPIMMSFFTVILSALTSLVLLPALIVAGAIALGALIYRMITDAQFRQEMTDAFSEAFDTVFGEGSFAQFQEWLQGELTRAGMAFGNFMLGIVDTIRSAWAGVYAQILEGVRAIQAGLNQDTTDTDIAIENSRREQLFFDVQSNVRAGESVPLFELLDAVEAGRSLGLNVDVLLGSIDEEVARILSLDTQPLEAHIEFLIGQGVDLSTINEQMKNLGLTNEQVQAAVNSGLADNSFRIDQVPLLIDGFDVTIDTETIMSEISEAITAGVDLSTINTTFSQLGLTNEQVDQIVTNLFTSGQITVSDIPILIDGFDVTIEEAGDIATQTQEELGLEGVSTEEAIQMVMQGQISIDQFEIVYGSAPDLQTAINNAMTTAIENSDLTSMGWILDIANATTANLSQGIVDGISSLETDPEFLAANSVLFQSFGELFDFTPEQLSQISAGLGEKFSEAMRWNDIGVAEDLRTLGMNMIDGVVLGMQERDTLTEEVQATADDVLNQFRTTWGIHSPSIVMEEMGRFLIEGLLNGLNSPMVSVMLTMMLLNMKILFLDAFATIREGMLIFVDGLIEDLGRFEERLDEHVDFVVSRYRDMISGISQQINRYVGLLNYMDSSTGAIVNRIINTLQLLPHFFQVFVDNIIPALNYLVGKLQGVQDAFSKIGNSVSGLTGSIGTGAGTNPDKKAFGGDVSAGRIYEILETNMGVPFELFKTANRTFFIPAVNGEIISPLSTNMNATGYKPEMGSITGGGISNTYMDNRMVVSVEIGDIGSGVDMADVENAVRRGIAGGLDDARKNNSLSNRLTRSGKN